MRRELRATARLAIPIALGLAGHGVMTTLDAAFLGRHSTEALAGCGIATNLHLPVLLIGYGMVTGVSVLSAQGRGAGDRDAGARMLRAGLILALLFGLGGALLLHAAAAAGVNGLFALTPEVHRQADGFLLAMAWSTPLSVIFQVLKNHAESHGRPWRALRWLGTGLAVNALLCAPLVFGVPGSIPELGALGAGLATIAGRVVMLAGMAWQERDSLRAALAPRASGALPEMTRFGVPCSLHMTAEVGVFALAPLVIGRWLGTESLAAHQIAISVAGLAFMLPLGIAQAVGIRVGEAYGEGDMPRARLIGWGGLLFSLSFMGAYAVIVACGHNVIPKIFTGEVEPETALIASRLLLVAAVFALADGVQVTLAGALRGVGDARFTSFVGLLAYWVIGLPAGLLLGFPLHLKVTGVWIGLASGLFFAAAAFIARWRRLSGPDMPRPGCAA